MDRSNNSQRQENEEDQTVVQLQTALAELQSLYQVKEDKNNEPNQQFKSAQDLKGIKIGILGAGVAGLNAAMQIDKLNKDLQLDPKIEYEILEGENRAGGRIFTHKYPSINEERWQYSDMGAMRLPIWHSPTYDLISYTNERIQEYNDEVHKINDANAQNPRFTKIEDYPQIELRDYFFDSRSANFNDLNDEDAGLHNIFYSRHEDKVLQQREIRYTDKAYQRGGPELEAIAKELKLQQKLYKKKMTPLRNRFVRAIKNTIQRVQNNPSNASFRNCPNTEDFRQLLEQYSDETVLKFFKDSYIPNLDPNFPREKYLQTLNEWEGNFSYVGFLQSSLVEQLFEDKDFEQKTPYEDQKQSIWSRGPAIYEYKSDDEKRNIQKWHTINGGLQKLTDGMLQVIGPRKVLFNHRITDIKNCTSDSNQQGPPRDLNQKIQVTCSNGQKKYYNRIICTLPTAACANINWIDFDNFKDIYDAFRNLNADPLFKHSLEFSHRFWEDPNIMDPYFAFIGGQIVSNLSSRNLVFPCYGYKDVISEIGDAQKEERPGTVLCYNFYQDGMRFIGMQEEERTQKVLSDMNIIFKKLVRSPENFDVKNYYTGNSFSQSWANTPSNGLAFFRPGQYELLDLLDKGIPDLVNFAGEHLSVHHGWIVGALQSSSKAIKDIVGNNDIRFLCPDNIYDHNGHLVEALKLEGTAFRFD